MCKEEIVDHRQLDNVKNATQRVSADADIEILIVLGSYLIVRPFSLYVGTKTDIEIPHKIIDISFAFLLF